MSLNSDILGLIYLQCHPYLARGLIYSSKFHLEAANKHKLPILQRWCFPDYSLQWIKAKYPSVTISQVIEASLYYYPLQESLYRFNKLELLYNACKHKFVKADLETFIDFASTYQTNKPDMASERADIQAMILYKFDRIQEFELSAKGLTQVLRSIKLNKKFTCDDVNSISPSIVFYNTILSLEDMTDLIFRMLITNNFHVKDYATEIAGTDNSGFFCSPSIRTINYVLGADKIKKLLSPYYPESISKVNHYNFPEEKRNAIINSGKNRGFIFSQHFDKKSKPYIRKHIHIEDIPNDDKCLHALETGDRLNFIIYRDLKYRIPSDYSNPLTHMLSEPVHDCE